jgi:isopenicillin-N epimerase
MRDLFLLDPTVTFLNHGSFGATPRPVFEAYQRWQLELERQPVEFLGRRHDPLLRQARERLGQYVNAAAEDLVFITNATWAVNVIARSMDLQPGDEILTTDHEYGACENVWNHVFERTGAKFSKMHIPLPLPSDAEMVERIWAGVTPRTKALYISHITSATAVTFPLEELVRRCREAGILSIIDGAHVVGQMPLDLTALDADFYTSNLHKWVCAPKGCAFMYARRELHNWLHAAIISWGYSTEITPMLSFSEDSLFATRNQYQGTRDISAFLAVGDALDFQAAHDWPTLRAQCHALAVDAQQRVSEITGQPIPVPPDNYVQLALCELPAGTDLRALKTRLYDQYRVEIPVTEWHGRGFIRISVQVYNTREDIDRLCEALAACLD